MSDVPIDRQCTMCENEAVDPHRNGALCEEHLASVENAGEQPDDGDDTPRVDDGNTPIQAAENADNDDNGENGSWNEADFLIPDSRSWPPERLEREQWMGHVEKKPFAPWGDRDAPAPCNKEGHTTADKCDCDARWKWGYTGHYVDGETVAMADDDPRLDGRVFLQQPSDPFAHVDGDNVRCPETDEVHPAFIAFLEHLGLTYADISTSGAGVHALYRGELPDGVKEAKWEIDTEAWGENDDLPSIEIYAGKRVCVDTGQRVPGTPNEIREWDTDALDALLTANDQFPTEPRTSAPDRDDFDLDDYEPDATGSDEATDEIRDIFAALDRLDARDVAERTIVHRWNDSATTSDGKRAFSPTWGRGSNGTANVVDSQIWQDTGPRGGWGTPVVMALIDAGELTDRGVSPRDARGGLWWKGVEHLRELGFSIPEYVRAGDVDADSSPEALKTLDVTLNPEVAWRAAEAVSQADLDEEPAVPTPAPGEGWLCPRCEGEIDVVRASAIDAGIVSDCSTPLRDDAYSRAYEHARRGLGAPLPEYVDREMVTERWDLVKGAIRQLDFGHLDEDALNSDITARGDDVDGDAELTIDPAWRESDTGESVLVFSSGRIYEAHPDHEGTIDVLRFAALDAGAISWEEFTDDEFKLSGDTFRDAYDTARRYGAPLPQWQGTDAYHTAVLPPADELLDENVGNDDRLFAAYDAVGDLYRDAAETDEATLMQVLPGLGKTGQVFRNATEYPALYTAGRKELMAEAAERCEKHGASWFVLPIFGENGPEKDVKTTAEAVVRERGQQLLREPWDLVRGVRENLPADTQLQEPEEYKGGGDGDDVELDRASCPTANGEHGLEWWLAVHAARARGHKPQQMHTNAKALFGEELPCTCDEDGEETTCEYTEAWEQATASDQPFDVLIGHYTHAHVEGARTYTYEENGLKKAKPRVVAVDEFPGGAFERDFGGEYPDIAAWLAGALRDDVADRQDLLTKADDLWNDESVREWLSPDDVSEEHGRIENALGAAQAGVRAVSTAEWLLENRSRALADFGVQDTVRRLVDSYPKFDAKTVAHVTAALDDAVNDPNNRGGHENVLNQLDDVVEHLGEVLPAEGSLDADISRALDDTPHVSGTLSSLVENAIEAFRQREDGVHRHLSAARDALEGGPEGCEALAMYADDGYAHPLANMLLYALIAPEESGDVDTVRTSNFTFGSEEGTRINSVTYQKSRILADRNHHGAVINHPPALTAAGDNNPTVCLDATGREALWQLAIGRDVTARDIHDTPRERRQFLREVNGLQMVQTTGDALSYEGDPSGKNFDDDVELVKEVGREYSDAVGQKPAVITTNDAETYNEDRLEDITSVTDHYGNLKGSNALSEERLAVLLGCQHFGDKEVEKWAAFAGEEATRTGYGMALDYNSGIANTALKHMREDQVMQAALRFGRDSDGALVFAHTGALRDDLPVVAQGDVVHTFTKQQQAIAKAASELSRRRKFTSSDVRDRIQGHDPSSRTVRRVLSELVDFGYLDKTETKNGLANEFSTGKEPQAAEIDLPDLDTRMDDGPGQDSLKVYYTWSVRVNAGESGGDTTIRQNETFLPAPDAAAATPPPG